MWRLGASLKAVKRMQGPQVLWPQGLSAREVSGKSTSSRSNPEWLGTLHGPQKCVMGF